VEGVAIVTEVPDLGVRVREIVDFVVVRQGSDTVDEPPGLKMDEGARAVAPSIVVSLFDDVDLLGVVAACLAHKQLTGHVTEAYGVRVAKANGKYLVGVSRVSNVRVVGRHSVGSTRDVVSQRVDAEDLTQGVVMLSTSCHRGLHGSVAMRNEEVSAVEGYVLDRVVVHGHAHAEDQTEAIIEHDVVAEVVAELHQHAVGVNGVGHIGDVR